MEIKWYFYNKFENIDISDKDINKIKKINKGNALK